MAKKRKRKEDQIFNSQGLKHFRKSYSAAEFRWGLVILLILVSITAWVIYKGKHPRPGLFSDGSKLLAKSSIKVVRREPLPPKRAGQPDPVPLTPEQQAANRLLPPGMGKKGWSKKATSQFDRNKLYVKINGRAGYFQSFGVKRLYFTTLVHKESNNIIDIELYDLGKAKNALGCYAGELSKKAQPQVNPQGMSHISRNALFISRGKYYIRIIGSDENDIVKTKLRSLRTMFHKRIKGDPLPWGYGFFIANMAVKANAISYDRENAFSFGFAKDVYKAKIGENAYMFIMAQHDAASAQAIQQKFLAGWMSYGSEAKDKTGKKWVKDRYINTYSTAYATERWVVGVQGADKWPQAQSQLARLVASVKKMGPALRKRSIPSTKRKPPVRKQPPASRPSSRPVPKRRSASSNDEGGY